MPIFRTLRNPFPFKSAKALWVKIHSFLSQCLELWITWSHCIEHWSKLYLTVSCKGKHWSKYCTLRIKDACIVFIFITILFSPSNQQWHPGGVLLEEKVTLFGVLLSRINFKSKQATCSVTTLESSLCIHVVQNKTVHQFGLVIPR